MQKGKLVERDLCKFENRSTPLEAKNLSGRGEQTRNVNRKFEKQGQTSKLFERLHTVTKRRP